MKLRKKEKKISPPRPLFRLTLIVIPMIIVVVLTLGLLYYNGFFMTAEQKTVGTWSRIRFGEYSLEKYTEIYAFKNDGTGIKTYTDKDGYTAKTEFTWSVTARKTLVIDGHVKYKWNPNYDEYFVSADKVATKYWYITKDKFYIGEDTSMVYELYEKVE